MNIVKRIRLAGESVFDRVGERLFAWRLDIELERRRRLERQRDSLREERDKAREQRTARREERDKARAQRDKARAELKQFKVPREQSPRNAQVTAVFNYHLKQKEWAARIDDLMLLPTSDKLKLGLEDVELLSGKREVRFSKIYPKRITPPETVAFVTVANDRFFPGLELLISTLLDVYPDMRSDFIIFHDGTINDFFQRRLKHMYGRCKFVVPDMSWLESVPSGSDNQKRIGMLGYMNIMATTLDYDRVVILDSDIVVLDDISALWMGVDTALGLDERPDVDLEHAIACYDCGVRPFVAKSSGTGRYIINSGVISLPRKLLNPAATLELQKLAIANSEPICRLLDRFADQKVWNRFLSDKPLHILPGNFNCNAKFLNGFLEGRTEFLRIVHFTGSKPWFTPDYLDPRLVGESAADTREPNLWRDLYRTSLGRRRLATLNRLQPRLPEMKGNGVLAGAYACIFIGNGPSLKRTPIERFGPFEKFVFNWFVLHEQFDEVRPENLILGSHMIFGGWNRSDPELPEAFLKALMARKWRPTIWTSFYFREYIEHIGLHDIFEVKYILFEKPFKGFIDKNGYVSLDAHGYVQDGRTGVLSLGVPIAASMGYKRIALVGCDSNYNQMGTDNNYFYSSDLHQSESTRLESLTSTWVNEGPGDTAYSITQSTLLDAGCGLIDYTVDGRLPLPKGDLSELLR